MKIKALFLITMILSMNLASLETQSDTLRILVYNTHWQAPSFLET